jgi:hypothetical protein
MTTHDNRGTDDGSTTTAEPVASAAVAAPATTPPSSSLMATTATPRAPSTSTPGPAPFRCGPIPGGGGVDVQQHLPSVMLAGALPYDLPPQQAGPTFAPSLTHLPLVAWPPWMTSGALPYGLPPQQAAPTFTSPLPPPPPTSWPPWMSSWSQQPLAHCFHTTVMVPPAVTDWVTDFSASNHTTSTAGNLTSIRPPLPTDPSSIIVSNRSSLLVTSVGTMAFPSPF